MRILGRLKLESFADTHPQVRAQVRSWLAEVVAARWESAHEIKKRYPRASVIHAGRVVFDLGRKFRVDTAIEYELSLLQILRFAFHTEYDRWKF